MAGRPLPPAPSPFKERGSRKVGLGGRGGDGVRVGASPAPYGCSRKPAACEGDGRALTPRLGNLGYRGRLRQSGDGAEADVRSRLLHYSQRETRDKSREAR